MGGIPWQSSGYDLCTLTAKNPGSIPHQGTDTPQAVWDSQTTTNRLWELFMNDLENHPFAYLPWAKLVALLIV